LWNLTCGPKREQSAKDRQVSGALAFFFASAQAQRCVSPIDGAPDTRRASIRPTAAAHLPAPCPAPSSASQLPLAAWRSCCPRPRLLGTEVRASCPGTLESWQGSVLYLRATPALARHLQANLSSEPQ